MAKNTDFIGFSFNERHSSEFNIYPVSDGSRYQDSLVPSPIDYSEQITGGIGSYYFGSDMDVKEFPLSIAYDNLSEKQIREMRKWLAPDSVGELIFDERPYKSYTAKINGSPTLSFICFDRFNNETQKNERVYKGEGEINFICYYPLAEVSSEKKELEWYRKQIDDKFYTTVGGNSSLAQYEMKDNDIVLVDKIKGNTFQEVYDGKNLFDASIYTNEISQSGITVKYIAEEDCVLLNGTVSQINDIAKKDIIIPVNSADIFSISITPKGGTVTKAQDSDYAVAYFGANDTYPGYFNWASVGLYSDTVSKRENIKCEYIDPNDSTTKRGKYITDFHFFCSAGVVFDNYKIQIQLEKNSRSTAYGKYDPPSPSPEVPSQIIGSNPTKVIMRGRNIFNMNELSIVSNADNLTFFDNGFSFKKTGGTNRQSAVSLRIYLLKGTYHIKGDCVQSDRKPGGFSIYDIESRTHIINDSGKGSFNRSFTIEKSKIYSIYFFCAYTSEANVEVGYTDVQLEYGDIATSYIKYAGKEELLPELGTLYGLNNVFDEYDVLTGKKISNWKKVEFDGTENWRSLDMAYAKYTYFIDIPDKKIKRQSSLCSHFVNVNDAYSVNVGRVGTYTDHSLNTYVYFVSDKATVEDFKTWITAQKEAGTPVTLVYQLDKSVSETFNQISLLKSQKVANLSGTIINIDKEYYNYITDSDSLLSLRIYGAKYPNVDEWAESSDMMESLEGYDKYKLLSDNSYGINYYNPGDLETGFILQFTKPTLQTSESNPQIRISINLDGTSEGFVLLLRSSDTDIESYGAVSDEERQVATAIGGTITIDTNKNRITYKNDSMNYDSSIYFALKEGKLFKLPVTSKEDAEDGNTTIRIDDSPAIDINSVKIEYSYLYY